MVAVAWHWERAGLLETVTGSTSVTVASRAPKPARPAPRGRRGHDRGVPGTPRPNPDDADDLIGRLLVASPQLGDPNFERAVVLLLDHGPEGAIGVVLNRPTGVPVEEILDTWREQSLLAPPGVVFSGGPVSPDAVIGLARTEHTDPGASGWRPVLDAVGTVDLSVPPAGQPVPLSGARLFSGYAGWSPDQLEAELAEGAWLVVDALAADVFAADGDGLWHDVLRRQGGRLALLAAYPPHPSVN
jgi:putative transcriptional regulator